MDLDLDLYLAKLIEAKSHLTAEGLAEIVEIKNEMNKSRVPNNSN